MGQARAADDSVLAESGVAAAAAAVVAALRDFLGAFLLAMVCGQGLGYLFAFCVKDPPRVRAKEEKKVTPPSSTEWSTSALTQPLCLPAAMW